MCMYTNIYIHLLTTTTPSLLLLMLSAHARVFMYMVVFSSIELFVLELRGRSIGLQI